MTGDYQYDSNLSIIGYHRIAKHLRQLEEADLVTSRKSGREKLHFLNLVPIRQVHLSGLKSLLENDKEIEAAS